MGSAFAVMCMDKKAILLRRGVTLYYHCVGQLTLSVSERRPSPVASTTALGVSLAVALANTPVVGSVESTMPMAS